MWREFVNICVAVLAAPPSPVVLSRGESPPALRRERAGTFHVHAACLKASVVPPFLVQPAVPLGRWCIPQFIVAA
jgi:hypothetical protein